MFHNPIKQRLFKPNVGAGFFALDPFVFQDFLALGQELFVEDRVLNKLRSILLARGHSATVFHKNENRSIKSRCVFASLTKHRPYLFNRTASKTRTSG